MGKEIIMPESRAVNQFVAQLVAMHDRAFHLGLFKTARWLTAAVKQVGVEVADKRAPKPRKDRQ